jgi:hypothetical protein
MPKLKLINIIKNLILEQPFGSYNEPRDPDDPNYGKRYSYNLETGETEEIGKINIDDVWSKHCSIILDNFEGGYWFNPTSLPNNEKCTNHPEPVGSSTETMFGIDRVMGDWDSKPEGRDFWSIIDKEKKDLGITKFCKKWVWLYRGGDKENILKSKACAMMLTAMKRNMTELKEAKNEVESNERLLFHFSYASWNGSGNFKRWAQGMNQAVKDGKKGNELVKLAIQQRNDWTSDMDDNLKKANNKVINTIKNDPNLGEPYIDDEIVGG